MAAQDLLDQKIQEAVAAALTTKAITEAIDMVLQHFDADSSVRRQHELESELAALHPSMKHVVNAIAKGQTLNPLLDKLKELQDQETKLQAELNQLQQADSAKIDRARLKQVAVTMTANLPDLFAGDITESRRLLRTLFEEPLKCWGDGSTFRVAGRGNLLNLLLSSAVPLNWRPQREYQAFDPTFRTVNLVILRTNQTGSSLISIIDHPSSHRGMSRMDL